jgi:hypothetical protein
VSILCRFFHETHQLFEISPKPRTRGYLSSKIEKKNWFLTKSGNPGRLVEH